MQTERRITDEILGVKGLSGENFAFKLCDRNFKKFVQNAFQSVWSEKKFTQCETFLILQGKKWSVASIERFQELCSASEVLHMRVVRGEGMENLFFLLEIT